MTLSDLEWLFHGFASRAISAVAELLVTLYCYITEYIEARFYDAVAVNHER